MLHKPLALDAYRRPTVLVRCGGQKVLSSYFYHLSSQLEILLLTKDFKRKEKKMLRDPEKTLWEILKDVLVLLILLILLVLSAIPFYSTNIYGTFAMIWVMCCVLGIFSLLKHSATHCCVLLGKYESLRA